MIRFSEGDLVKRLFRVLFLALLGMLAAQLLVGTVYTIAYQEGYDSAIKISVENSERNYREAISNSQLK